MGQTYGKTLIKPLAVPFASLPANVVAGMWEDYNQVAEGFGIEKKRLCALFQIMEIHMASNDDLTSQNEKLRKFTKAFFDFIDTDKNGIVDGLECLAGLAMLSTMTIQDKLEYIYRLYDFELRDRLVLDEMSMAAVCLCTALEKMTTVGTIPSPEVIELVSKDAFKTLNVDPVDSTVAIPDLARYIMENPDTMSFVRHFDDLSVPVPDIVVEKPYDEAGDLKLDTPAQAFVRTELNVAFSRRQFPKIHHNRQASYTKAHRVDEKNTWRKVVPEMMASRYEGKVQKVNEEVHPKTNYRLDHIHGVNALPGTHSDVYYAINENHIVFSAGAVCIVQDTERHRQSFFQRHTDQVVCLAVSKDRLYAASGDAAPSPSIYVWRLENPREAHAVIRGMHSNAVAHVDFSTSGKSLVTMGRDENNSVLVYGLDYTKPLHDRATLLFGANTTKLAITGIHFVNDEDDFFSYGYCHATFWVCDSREGWVGKEGVFHRSIGQRNLTCARSNFELNLTVAGCSSVAGRSGDLVMWRNNDRHCYGHVRAHIGKVTTVDFAPSGKIVSGGEDGLVKLWTDMLRLVSEFDIGPLGCFKMIVRSVQFSPSEENVLVRSPGCIAEINAKSGVLVNEHPLIQSHCAGQLWGLAAHPSRHQVCTVGDDATVRIFDLLSRKLLKLSTIPGWAQSPARCATYSPCGTLVAVGLSADNVLHPPPPLDIDAELDARANNTGNEDVNGEPDDGGAGKVTNKKSGAWFILKEDTLEVIFQARDSLAGISAVAFSPNGKVLAVASFDYLVYMYNAVDNEFNIIGRCLGHKGPPTHLDFSVDSQWIQSTSSTTESGEVRWFDGETSEPNFSHDMFKETKWQNGHGVLNWYAQGAWDHDADEAFILSVATKRSTSVFLDEELVVSGDAQGRLRLFCSPVVTIEGDKPFKEYRGHVGGVSNVVFSFDGTFIVSTGVSGRCIFQYIIDNYAARALGAPIVPFLPQSIPMAPISKSASTESLDETSNYVAVAPEPTPGKEALITKRQTIGPSDEAGFAVQPTNYQSELERAHAIEASMNFDLEEELVEGFTSTKKILASRPWGKACELPKQHKVDVSLRGVEEEANACEAIKDTPIGSLELDWVYGCRTEGLSGLIRYSQGHEILFNAGRYAVLQTVREWKKTKGREFEPGQRYFGDHLTEICAMDLVETQSGTIVATGDMGEFPTVHVWHMLSLRVECTIRYVHQLGIKKVKFSPAGHKLAILGADENQTITVHDSANGDLQHRIAGGRPHVFDLCFSCISEDCLLQIGMHHIIFHELSHGEDAISIEMADLDYIPCQPFLACVWTSEGIIVSGWDGSLFDISSEKTSKSSMEDPRRHLREVFKDAHDAPINTLRAVKTPRAQFNRVLSGGDDGKIKVWSWHISTRKFDCLEEFDIAMTVVMNPCIRSVDLDMDHEHLLVATLSAEVVEVNLQSKNMQKATVVVEGHFMEGEHLMRIQDIAGHPKKNEFATVGDDRWLRIWDAKTHKILQKLKLEAAACCVVYDPTGENVCVGLGPAPGKKRGALKAHLQLDGAFQIVDSKKLVIKHTGRDTRSRLTVARFTPDVSTLAIGCADRRIYVYDVNNTYELLRKLMILEGIPIALDFSDDSKHIRAASNDEMELVYAEIATGHTVQRAVLMKDTIWASHSCPYRWETSGLWAAEETARDLINTDQSDMFNIIVGVDKMGTLRVTNSPCKFVGRTIQQYANHTSSEGKVKILADGASPYIVTTGKTDRAVYQWKFLPHKFAEGDNSGKNPKTHWTEEAKKPVDRYGDIGNRPWQSGLLPPSGGNPVEDKSPPPNSARLKHVFGLSPKSIFYTRSGDIIYSNAAMGVKYDKLHHRQSFYFGHAPNKITAVHVDYTGHFVVSGEECNCPQLRVWSASTCNHIATLPKLHRKSIKLVHFSRSANQIVSVGGERNQVVAIWERDHRVGEWQRGRLKCFQSFGKLPIFFAAFSESQQYHGAGGHELFTGGASHVTLWKITGLNLLPIRTYRQYASPFLLEMDREPPVVFAAMLCGALCGPDIVTGSAAGDIFIWHTLRGEVSQYLPKRHAFPISAITSKGEVIITGDFGSNVKIWNGLWDLVQTFSLDNQFEEKLSKIVTMAMDFSGEICAVTTDKNEVYEISLCGAGGYGHKTLLLDSHYYWNLRGLDLHPFDEDIFVTVGDDSSIRIWSIKECRMLRKGKLNAISRAVSWSPDGKFIAIGFGGASANEVERSLDGSFQILDASSFKVIYHGRNSQQWVTDIRYSPDGSMLALASFDSKIYVYDALREYVLRSVMKKHNGFVNHIDFSSENDVIMSNSGIFELYFSRINGPNFGDGDDAILLEADDARDLKWPMQTCTLAWHTRGAWPVTARPTPVNSAHVSFEGDLLVTGNDDGVIKLFKFPAWTKGQEAVSLYGHAPNISRVLFTRHGQKRASEEALKLGDRRNPESTNKVVNDGGSCSRMLLSCGAEDRAIFVWEVCAP